MKRIAATQVFAVTGITGITSPHSIRGKVVIEAVIAVTEKGQNHHARRGFATAQPDKGQMGQKTFHQDARLSPAGRETRTYERLNKRFLTLPNISALLTTGARLRVRSAVSASRRSASQKGAGKRTGKTPVKMKIYRIASLLVRPTRVATLLGQIAGVIQCRREEAVPQGCGCAPPDP